MKEKNLFEGLNPGEYYFDNSAHRYHVAGRSLIGYEWVAVDKSGKRYLGYCTLKEDAQREAVGKARI